MGLLHRLTEIVKNGEASACQALAASDLPIHGREIWGSGACSLWAGDNLEGLAGALRGDPGLGTGSLRGKVDMVSIDPPYFRHVQARQRHEVGNLTDSVMESKAWSDGGKGGMEGHLTRLYARLFLIRELLSPRGSLYVQVDRILAPWLRVLLDELFGDAGFVNEITWKRANAHNDARRFGSVCDAILLYGKGPERIWNPAHRSALERETDPHWRRDEEGRLFRIVPVDAPRRGKAATRLYPWKGRLPAPGRAWAFPQESMDALERDGRLVQSAAGLPGRLVYADEMPGATVQDLWDDIPALSLRSSQREDYPTQKPEALAERMLLASSQPGSWVLDAYAGSGTLGAVAQRHGRRCLLMDEAPAAHLVQRRRLGAGGLGVAMGAVAKPPLVRILAMRVATEGVTVQIGLEVTVQDRRRFQDGLDPLDLVEGWAVGAVADGVFTVLASTWRPRALGRRGELTDFVKFDSPLPEEFEARVWDIEGGQASLGSGEIRT
jgi:DNA modification methylase